MENLQQIQFAGFLANFRAIKRKANTCDYARLLRVKPVWVIDRNGK
jgi:hypothetical protein